MLIKTMIVLNYLLKNVDKKMIVLNYLLKNVDQNNDCPKLLIEEC